MGKITEKPTLQGADELVAVYEGTTGPVTRDIVASALLGTGPIATAMADKVSTEQLAAALGPVSQQITDLDAGVTQQIADLDSGTAAQFAAVNDEITDQAAQIAALSQIQAPLTPRGNWSAAGGAFPSGAVTGDYWITDTAGTVDGVAFAVGDRLVATVDAASTTTFAGNWLRDAASTVTAEDLATKAPLASPAFSGTATGQGATFQRGAFGVLSAPVTEQLATAQVIGRAVDPVTGSGLPEGTWVYAEPVTADGIISRVRAWGATTGTLKMRRWRRSGTTLTQSGSDTSIAVVAGAVSVDVNAAVEAGEYVGFYIPNGLISAAAETADSGGMWTAAGVDSTSFSDDTLNGTVRPQIGFDILSPLVTTAWAQGVDADALSSAASIAAVRSGLGDIATADYVDVEAREAYTQFAGTAFGEYTAALLLDGVATGTAIERLTLYRQYVAATATQMRLTIYRRTDGTTGAPPEGCTVLFSQDYPLADLGITAGATDRPDVDFVFPRAFVVEEGNHLAWRAQALDATDTPVAQSFGPASDASASASERGWYRSSPSATAFTALESPNAFASAVARVGYTQSVIVNGLTDYDATVTVDGTDVTVTGTMQRLGATTAISATLSPTLAASGQERMDLIQYDPTTGAVSLVAGDERDEQLDALEWQNSLTAGSVLLGRARVGDAAVQAVSATRGLTPADAAMSRHIERNRAILRGVVAKAQRGEAINLGGYGDSITALQSSTPPYTANGTMRDRAANSYLGVNYPADTVAQVTLYDFGDGAGQVHTRLGWNWAIKSALDQIAGSEVVTYLNYGIGGSTSANSENNGLWPARIAEPLGDALDIVMIAFGMNERGATSTYANIVNMIGQFQSAGVTCAVMGVPRPNANQSLSAWRYTNHALETAAMDTGAAYISTLALADDATIGGMGVPAEALASANTIAGGNNHPGIYELRRYEAAAVAQLGL